MITKRILFDIVFHGTQTTVHLSFQNSREEKKTSEGDETIEGTLVRVFLSFD
jgi:hypothetical protein